MFAHNGDLPAIERTGSLAFDRYRPVGTTDSEHAFCALLQRLHGLWASASGVPLLEERLAAISRFAAELRKLGPANFLYADGDALFAHGDRRLQAATGKGEPPGLHLLSRRCDDESEPVHAQGLSVAPGFGEVLLVASVPLTGEKWRPFMHGEVVAASAGRVLA